MTAEEIRSDAITSLFQTGDQNKLAWFHAKMLQEIAAQLAEFNERCAQNCTKIEEKK